MLRAPRLTHLLDATCACLDVTTATSNYKACVTSCPHTIHYRVFGVNHSTNVMGVWLQIVNDIFSLMRLIYSYKLCHSIDNGMRITAASLLQIQKALVGRRRHIGFANGQYGNDNMNCLLTHPQTGIQSAIAEF